jgi:outer membrane protein assembly factor BamB
LQEKKLNWTHEGLEEISTFMGSSMPTVSNGIVIVTYSSGEIYALNELNGSVIWNDNLSLYIQKQSLDNISDIRGNPVINDNKLYVISYSGKMISLDLNSGIRLWESNIGGIQTPWVVSRFIFVLSKDNELICLSSKDGKVIWVSKLKDFMDFEKKEKNILWTGPLLAGRMLIVSGSHGIIASISPYSGKFLGAINIKSSVETHAVVADRTVFFLTVGGDLLAYR